MILKRLWFPLLCVLLGFFTFYLTTLGSVSKSNTIIQVAVSPGSASVSINGKAAKVGNNDVGYAGNYNVVVSKSGFTTRSEIVNVNLGESIYVGLALQSDSPSTSTWYQTHAKDAALSDQIGSHGADTYNAFAESTNPFLKVLPLSFGDGSGGLISVYQGVPLTKNGPPALYVNAATPQDRQEVLSYMKNGGYDPAVSDMVFNQVNIPLVVANE